MNSWIFQICTSPMVVSLSCTLSLLLAMGGPINPKSAKYLGASQISSENIEEVIFMAMCRKGYQYENFRMALQEKRRPNW